MLSIELDQYQKDAYRTANPSLSKNQLLSNWAYGLTGELGELAEPLKKHIHHGKHELNIQNLGKECGDLFWYLAALATDTGINLPEAYEWANSQVAFRNLFSHAKNQDKLSKWDKVSSLLRRIAYRVGDICYFLDKQIIEDTHLFYDFGQSIGIVFLYVEEVARLLELDPVEIRKENIAKLKARYPEKFTSELSVNREEYKTQEAA